MFSLPRQFTKPTHKNPNKSHTNNHSYTHRKPNINQIKQEIEYILKRNNSPISLNIQKQVQKSHKNIHFHLLQRKRSKILQRANEQNIEKAKNNRKIYEEYLMGDLAPKTSSKTIEPKQNLHNFNPLQTSFSKEIHKDFTNSKAKFNSTRTLELLRKQKKSQSMFTDKQIQHLGLGKLLFYKDSNIKLKRSSLLEARTSTDRNNLFKDTAMESFYHEPSLDITRYLKHLEKSTAEEDQAKMRKPESAFMREKSLEIFRKDILPKESPSLPKEPLSQQIIPPQNPEGFGVMGYHKDYFQLQKQPKRLTKHQISPHFKNKTSETIQTLNVMDEQLLVYYGKMKNRKPSKEYLPAATHRTTTMCRSGSRDNPQNLSKFLDIGVRTSMEIKKPMVKQNSWRFHTFDPWEKQKHEEELDHENVFGELEAHNLSLFMEQSLKNGFRNDKADQPN